MRKHNFLLYAVLLVLVIGWSFYLQLTEIKNFAQDIAHKQTGMLLENFVQFRQWYAQHQSLYAPVTDRIQPNPHIQLPERDIQTADGLKLTMIEPFCMSGELAKFSSHTDGLRFHITSLNPMRPENKADDWESLGLTAFTKGETSRSEMTSIDGKPYYRHMLPLPVDDSCLKCHAQQGVQPGKTYGGVSVAMSASVIEDLVFVRTQHSALIHILIALTGFSLLLVAHLSQKKMQRRLEKAKRHLQLAYLDVLTHLPNRRYYDFFVNREWKRAKRQIYPLSMIMIDIDYFKIYNDNYGHIQGDECLKQVAKTLRKFFRRAGDLIARYGGEEFCVVAACDSEQITQLAEILRKAVEDLKLPHSGSKVSDYVTISLGTATVLPTESMEFEALLRQADQTLYRAKANGRNRVETYGGSQFLRKL